MKKIKSYLLRDIPLTLWVQLRHRAIDEGITIRALILSAIAQYIKEPTA